MFGLAMLFVYVFLCPFSILITWFGEEGAGLCDCICLLAMHTLICVTFSLPPAAAASASGSSWTFLFTFLRQVSDLYAGHVYIRRIEWDNHRQSLTTLATNLSGRHNENQPRGGLRVCWKI